MVESYWIVFNSGILFNLEYYINGFVVNGLPSESQFWFIEKSLLQKVIIKWNEWIWMSLNDIQL